MDFNTRCVSMSFGTHLRTALLLILIALPQGCDHSSSVSEKTQPLSGIPKGCEIVMTDGMQITVTNQEGTIMITAEEGLRRSYTWEGATRSVTLSPRLRRWYGSMGAFYPGPGFHWQEHNGIRRAVINEGQQHFESVDEAMAWINSQRWSQPVWRDDGLVVGYRRVFERYQLNVDVWQILINGEQPNLIAGESE